MKSRPFATTISDDRHISVTFEKGTLQVILPNDKEQFYGKDVLCGLAGNFDEDCLDDFRLPYGLVIFYEQNYHIYFHA